MSDQFVTFLQAFARALDPDLMHSHKCGKCGFVWEHANEFKGNVKAHTCPKCETEQWERYDGDCKPQMVHLKQRKKKT
jgi:predicted Zn-ribbon and HTH transcriptional regulator